MVTTEQTTENNERHGNAIDVRRLPVAAGDRGLVLNDLDSMWRFAQCVAGSNGFAPKGMERPESILVAIQFGMELGLSPMTSLQSIAVINGRPSIYGDTALALVRASGLLEYIIEKYEGQGEARRAVCESKRKDCPEPMRSEFSVDDAKRATLWGKAGPWTQYPDRMLRFRARGFNLRDNFGDVLRGLRTVEENQDLVIEPADKPAAQLRRADEVVAKLEAPKAEAKPEKPEKPARKKAEAPAPIADPAPPVETYQQDAPAPSGMFDQDAAAIADWISDVEDHIEHAETVSDLNKIGAEMTKRKPELGPAYDVLLAKYQEKFRRVGKK